MINPIEATRLHIETQAVWLLQGMKRFGFTIDNEHSDSVVLATMNLYSTERGMSYNPARQNQIYSSLGRASISFNAGLDHIEASQNQKMNDFKTFIQESIKKSGYKEVRIKYDLSDFSFKYRCYRKASIRIGFNVVMDTPCLYDMKWLLAYRLNAVHLVTD